jgi:hypothetical protein
MAEVIKRTCRSGPRGVKRTSWGYTLQVNDRPVRRFNATWSEDDAQKALAARILEVESAPSPVPATRALGELVDGYLCYKGTTASAR